LQKVYIHQYRKESGISELTWDSVLEQTAKYTATSFAEGVAPISDSTCLLVGRQCSSATNAQEAVSDWIEGNKYIRSESNDLLDDKYTQIGGALYYLPNGSESGYHYFWIVCLR